MFHKYQRLFVFRFFIGFMFGFLTVTAAQLAFAQNSVLENWDDWDSTPSPLESFLNEESDEQGVYERLYPDVDPRDGYNWDTNRYEDVEIINDNGVEIEIYNWDRGEYQWVQPE